MTLHMHSPITRPRSVCLHSNPIYIKQEERADLQNHKENEGSVYTYMHALRTMFRYEDDIKRNFFWSVRRNSKFFQFSKEIMRCCNYRNYVTVILISKIQTWSLNAIGVWDKSPSTFIITFWWHHRWRNLRDTLAANLQMDCLWLQRVVQLLWCTMLTFRIRSVNIFFVFEC